MRLGYLLNLLAFSYLFSHAIGANILFHWAFSGYSHRISVWPIVEKLAERGHNITFLSPYKDKSGKALHPNINDFVPAGLLEQLGVMGTDYIAIRLAGGVAAIDNLWYGYMENCTRACEFVVRDSDIRAMAENSNFDLVVVNAFNECAYGYVHKFKAPFVIYSSSSHMPWYKDAFGHVDENFPEMQTHYGRNATFLQKVKNALVSVYWEGKKWWDIFPRMEKMFREGMPMQMGDLPSFREIEKNASLLLINQHFTEEYPRSLPPNVKGIGGIHCSDERKPLPQDLADYIATADEGFIYLSFGTYASLSSLPQRLQYAFFNAIAKFPEIKFIIKYQGEPAQPISKNVKIVTWINQQDIIAHPKIRAFIGHGGLLSTQEAVYHGVPMIVLPIFVEQDFNAVRAHERGTAIALEISDLNEEKLVDAISQILHDKRFKEKARKLSKLFRDRQMKPLDSAVWWIEYVLRYKDDTSHLLPVGAGRTWYERRMLDIWGFLAIIFLLAVTLMAILVRGLIILVLGTKSKAKSKSD